jgi:hypothetical protein
MPILTAGFDGAAFLADADGTWTVICDTKIVEDCAAPLSNTLHAPNGTVIERGSWVSCKPTPSSCNQLA